MFSDVSVEKVASFWNTRPCNLKHSLKPIGTAGYFNEVEKRKYFVEPHIPIFAEFERWKDKHVLEIGCGIGTDTINFARAGAWVTAVDLSEKSLGIAQARARLFGLGDRVHFYRADAEELSKAVPPEAYDLVYSFGAIHHTPHPERVINEIRDHYMKTGSVLKLMVYHRYSWKALQIVLQEGKGAFWKWEALLAKNSEAQTGCPVTYTYSRKSAKELLKGFKIQDLSVKHIFPYRISDYVQYRYVKEMHFRLMPAPVFGWLENRFGWHLCVTASFDS